MDLGQLNDPGAPTETLREAYRKLQRLPFAQALPGLRALGTNPNCPEDILRQIAWKLPLSAAQNPAIPLSELVEPGWFLRALCAGAQRTSGLAEPTPEQTELLAGISDPATPMDVVHTTLRTYAGISLEDAPPGLDWPFLAALKHPDFDLVGILAANRPLGLRILEVVGRRIEARRYAGGKIQPAIGDRDWNPFFRIPRPLDLARCQDIVRILQTAKTDGVWEKSLLYRQKALAGVLGYAAIVHGPVGPFGPLAVDEAARAFIPCQRTVDRPPAQTIGCARIAAWMLEAFPFLGIAAERLAPFLWKDTAHAGGLAPALRTRASETVGRLDIELRRHIDEHGTRPDPTSWTDVDARIFSVVARRNRQSRLFLHALTARKEADGWTITLQELRAHIPSDTWRIPFDRRWLLAYVLRTMKTPGTAQDIVDAVAPLAARP